MKKKRIQISIDAKKFERWKKLEDLFWSSDVDDHTKCPECGKQGLHCGCAKRLADDILTSAIEIKKDDEQFFDSALRREPDGQYWILKRGASGWVRLDRFVEKGDES
ncbi:hypothetical protein [Shimazuella kribbensis]|uniref:hypothetical protein n=1 Tax=Shimazuella kribbensis TaxID=139808 RepID=UPI0003FB5817|nr:hypothetical protein [Shimazuella kribbensis]